MIGISAYTADFLISVSSFTLYGKFAIIILSNSERTVNIMGMTNKQFQGFIRLALGWLDKALEESPDNKNLQALKDIFQSMLEDD
jgi:hypothetical protein